MKKVIKGTSFFLVLVVFIYALNFALVPKYKLFKDVNYEIAGEKSNTIDTIFLGDSLVYSSISPMELWGEYGYTTYDAAEPAQIIQDTYSYLKFAVEQQNPKVVMMETNVFFRDAKNRPEEKNVARKIRRVVPLFVYHDNWKKYLKNGIKKNWIDVEKGYHYVTKVKANKNTEYKYDWKENPTIPEANYKYIEKIVNLCEKHGITLIFINNPSLVSWTQGRHDKAQSIADQYGIPFIDLNVIDLGIDWDKETKDDGSHLNDSGARKVTAYLGKYLEDNNLAVSHKGDKKYNSWNKAYKMHLKKGK